MQSQIEFLRGFFEKLPLGVMVRDPDGFLIYANPAFSALTGYPPEEVATWTQWLQQAHPDAVDRKKAAADWQSARHQASMVKEFKIACRNQQVRDILFQCAFLSDGHLLTVLIDMTPHRRALRELAVSHDLMKSILNAVPDLLMVVDRDYRILFSNDKGHESIISEASNPTTCYGRFKLLHEPCVDCSASTVFDTGRIHEREMVNPADGRAREVRAFPIFDAHGRVDRVVEHIRDITDLQQARIENTKRQQFLEAVLYHAPDAIVTLDPNHRVIDWNPGAVQMFGYTAAEALGRNLDDLVAGEDFCREARQKTEQVLAGRRIEAFETVRYRKDGVPLNVIVAGSPIIMDGTLVGVVAMYTDVTSRKQTEEALRDLNKSLKTILDSIPADIYVADIDTYEVIFMNQQMKNAFGRDCTGEICWQAFRDGGGPCAHCTNAELLDEKGRPRGITIWEGQNPLNQRWYLNYDRAVPWIDGRLVRIQIATDISERKAFEKDLQQTRAMLQAAFNQSPAGIVIADAPDVRIRYANPAAYAIRGGEADQLTDIGMGQHTARWQTFHPDGTPYDPKFLPLSKAVLRGEASEDVEVIIRHASGEERWVSANAAPILDAAGTIQAGIVVFHDITDRVKAEAALRESEEKYRSLVEESPLGISLISQNGRYKYLNPAFCRMFGYTTADVPTGDDWFRKAYPDAAYRKSVLKAWKEDVRDPGEAYAGQRTFTVVCKDGSRKEIHFRMVRLKSGDQFVIHEDVTEKTKLERQLQQALKFEAIGTLAGGVAHDFNNILMGIQGRASLITVTLSADNPLMEHLQAIEEYVRSASHLTRQLLGFARGGKYEVKAVNLNQVLTGSAAMFSRTRKEIEIHLKTEASPLIVQADRRQIEQLLLNLYVNAWQAMPAGGQMFLAARSVVLDEAYCEPHQARPGRYAQISVVDTGIGMSESVRLRIFDPFFTTKEKSRGTGLGLASAYGIIKNHGGFITVYSEEGIGSTFNVYLPQVEEEVRPEAAPEARLIRGSETILLVDDEIMVLKVAQAMLEALGYRVIVAQGGAAAVKIAARRRADIDLVILDLVMPGMNGRETFDHVRQMNPALPIMLSSGYSANGQIEKILKRGCEGFIQKPFNIAELSRRVREVLDKPPKGPQMKMPMET